MFITRLPRVLLVADALPALVLVVRESLLKVSCSNSGYDFGYFVKLLTGQSLPINEETGLALYAIQKGLNKGKSVVVVATE